MWSRWFLCVLWHASCFRLVPTSIRTRRVAYSTYCDYFEDLLRREYQEGVEDLKIKRSKWSRRRLTLNGLAVFDGYAQVYSEVYGEKLAKVTTPSTYGVRLDRAICVGDVFSMSCNERRPAFASREVVVVETGENWVTVALGDTWPKGWWEDRRHEMFSKRVTLDKFTPPDGALRAQLKALSAARNGEAGNIAAILSSFFNKTDDASNDSGRRLREAARSPPNSSAMLPPSELRQRAEAAVSRVGSRCNEPQRRAVVNALRRRISLVRGPPGTGKTTAAALLVAAKLRFDEEVSPSTRILAVAHSNSAADVLLEALVSLGVPAVRAGRPTTVSDAAKRHTIDALAHNHPEMKRLRAQSANSNLSSVDRAIARSSLAGSALAEVRRSIARAAPVIVASCVGAAALSLDQGQERFSLVVLDEASQTTEPALLVALAAAKADQLTLFGDTKQLPPTVVTRHRDLRASLGLSPMARLLQNLGQDTLSLQYRMPRALLEFPSKHFYNGEVRSANYYRTRPPPRGFPFPNGQPLAFVDVLGSEALSSSSSMSNMGEVDVVVRIVRDLIEAGDVEEKNICAITPYRNQVDALRGSLQNVIVGTVDSFQGREYDVVVVSTVRSNAEGDLGFLHDPRRLCVTLTRARRALILVGNTRVLRNSRHWSALLDHCHARGCIIDAEPLVTSCSNSKPASLDNDVGLPSPS